MEWWQIIEDKFKEQHDRIEELESKLAMKQNIIDHLEIKCDDNEQYSRRSCLRIHGLDFSSDEDEGVLKKLEKCYSDMRIEFNQNEMIALITLVNLIWTRRKTKFDQFC